MSKLPPLEKFINDKYIKLEPQYRQIYYELVQSGFSPEINTRFLQEISPILKKIENSYLSSFSSPILKGKLKALALKAIKDYDPYKAQLNTFLYTKLKTIMEELRHEVSPFYVSSKVALDQQRIIQAMETLKNELQREPSVAELADYTGLSIQKIEKALKKLPSSITEGAATQSSDEDGGETEIYKNVPVELQRHSKEKLDAVLQALYYDLSPREQLLLEHIYGLFGKKKKPLNQLARELKITPARVSQLKSDLDRKISEYLSMIYNT